MGVKEGVKRLAVANLLMLYSLLLGLFDNAVIQSVSVIVGVLAFYLQYVGWKEMERVKEDYSPGKRSVIETANGIIISLGLSLIAFVTLRARMLYMAFALSLASLTVALYFTVKATVDYLRALKAVDRDYKTKLFWGGLLAVVGIPVAIVSYYLNAYPIAGTLPAALGLSILTIEFWKIYQASK